MQEKFSDDVLNDVSPKTGKARPWREKKIASGHLSFAYSQIVGKRFESKADRLIDCGNYLTFDECKDITGKQFLRVKAINSCRVRLCPLCMWRRSRRIASHLNKVLDAMEDDETEYAYLFLTLTIPNVRGEHLKECIDDLMTAFNRFIGYKRVKSAVLGWFRSLEVTHNLDKTSDSYDTYHPHFHILLAVNPNYLTGKSYIEHSEWLDMWRRACKNERITQVNIKRIKASEGVSIGSAVAETAKYSVKDADYITDDDEMTQRTVEVLDTALDARRLVAFGGVMKEWHRKLDLGELETEDVQTEDDGLEQVEQKQRVYWWDFQRRNYYRCK
jgi:plasmid rolling circle replication initiator protein Rep